MVQSMQHFRLDRIPDNLLRDPLQFLIADHVRQRKICNALDALVHGTERAETGDTTAAILTYLVRDLPLHISDEEIDLFPALQRADGFDDEMTKLIDALKRDHATALSLAQNVMTFFREERSPFADSAIVEPLARLFGAFTDCVRGQVAIEDRILIPLARKRLSDADLDRIGRAMAARRDIDYPD